MNSRTVLAAALAGSLLIGGSLLVSSPTVEGCGARCCKRPAGAPVESCLRRNPTTGTPEDFGDENTMPGTHAVGAGCVPAECVAGEGVQRL